MKKIAIFFVLCATLFGCAKPAANVEISSLKDDFYEAIDEGTIQYGAMAELDDTMLKDIYGIDANDLESYFVAMPLMNVQANEVAMFEVKEGKMAVVKEAVENRLTALEEQWQHYLADQMELVQNAKTWENGNYYFMVISSSADETMTLIESAFK